MSRQPQASRLETFLLWIIIVIGMTGLALLYSGASARDTSVIVAENDARATEVPLVISLRE